VSVCLTVCLSVCVSLCLSVPPLPCGSAAAAAADTDTACTSPSPRHSHAGRRYSTHPARDCELPLEAATRARCPFATTHTQHAQPAARTAALHSPLRRRYCTRPKAGSAARYNTRVARCTGGRAHPQRRGRGARRRQDCS
jgi:hypothetical protein